jgi:hypothetical protein
MPAEDLWGWAEAFGTDSVWGKDIPGLLNKAKPAEQNEFLISRFCP